MPPEPSAADLVRALIQHDPEQLVSGKGFDQEAFEAWLRSYKLLSTPVGEPELQRTLFFHRRRMHDAPDECCEGGAQSIDCSGPEWEATYADAWVDHDGLDMCSNGLIFCEAHLPPDLASLPVVP